MTDFVEISCHTCKVSFGLARATYATLVQSCGSFTCPFGHAQHFLRGESEEDKLRKERDRLKQNAAYLEDRNRQEREARDRLKQNAAYLEDRNRQEREAREAAERRASAVRGQVTRLKNRAANGVCPCCSRSFVDLRRHMQTKHAGFIAEEVQGDVGKTLQ